MLLLLPTSVFGVDGLSGGYVLISPDAISYLRIIQRGSDVSGYIQEVSSSSLGEGYNVSHRSIMGSVSGKSIALQGQSGLVDGIWSGDKIILASPVSGFVAKTTFTRISVTDWNKIATQFIVTRQRAAQIAEMRLDYNNRVAAFAAAKASIEMAQQNYSKALEAQKQAQKNVSLAQSKLDTARAELAQARQGALEAEMKAKQTNNPDDQLTAGNAETKVGNAEVSVGGADGNLIAARDNTISGLAGANNDVAQAAEQIINAKLEADSCIALMTADLKQLRAIAKTYPTHNHR